MLILLPPSETKRPGGRQLFAASALARGANFGIVHGEIRAALESVSGDPTKAVKALKLGVKNHGEREHNLVLDTSGTMPAIERYTGVLYDALDVHSTSDTARRWIDDHVLVQSALFGLLNASDEIPAYRLSASSRLPELGKPLARAWAPVHADALADAKYVLDLRSKDYAALAPLRELGAASSDVVEVVTRGESGEVYALNHFNKAAKGDLVRRLAEGAAEINSRAELFAWAASAGVEFSATDEPGTVRLVTSQGAPATNR